MCPPRFSNNGKRCELPELEARSVPGQHRPQLHGRAVVRGVLLELPERLRAVLRQSPGTGMYRVVQLDSTQEIEVFYMLF